MDSSQTICDSRQQTESVDVGHTPCWIIESGFDDFASSFLLFSKNCKELTDLGNPWKRDRAAATFFDVRIAVFFRHRKWHPTCDAC